MWRIVTRNRQSMSRYSSKSRILMLFKQWRDMISSLSCHADTILDHIEKLEIVGTRSDQPIQTYPTATVVMSR